MSTKVLVLGIVGAGCIAAAGVGGYVAVRMGSGDRAEGASLPSAPIAPSSGSAASAPADRASADTPTSSMRPASFRSAAQGDTSRTTHEPVAQPVAAAPEPSIAAAQSTTPATAETVPVPVTATPVTEIPTPVESTPRPRLEELTVKEDSVIGISLETALSSETARVEDKVIARVTRDVTVNGHTAIPAGARLEGSVTAVERGGKFRNAARLSLKFTSLVLADNTRVTIQTEALSREGEGPGSEATAKVGASSVIGAVIGGLIGGKKGAAVGAGAGAAGGSAAVAAGGRNSVNLPAGTSLTVKLTSPVTVLIERGES